MWSHEEIEHAADRAFRVRGRDLAELFTNAALALTTVQAAIGNKAGVEALAYNLCQFGISAKGTR